jgi:hypothetical protein
MQTSWLMVVLIVFKPGGPVNVNATLKRQPERHFGSEEWLIFQ